MTPLLRRRLAAARRAHAAVSDGRTPPATRKRRHRDSGLVRAVEALRDARRRTS